MSPINPRGHRDRENSINLVRINKSGSDIEETGIVTVREGGKIIGPLRHRKSSTTLDFISLIN